MSTTRTSQTSRAVVAAATLGLLAAAPLPAFGAVPVPALESTSATPPLPCDSARFADGVYLGGSPRVRSIEVAGIDAFVLLPPGYDTATRRYPVVYLFHGAFSRPDQYLDTTDLIDFTAAQTDAQQAIVVLANGGDVPLWVDWYDGTRPYEQLFVDELLPHIDRTYRTIPDGLHRAVAGFSGGGGGAASLAARHPELFAAVGVFSGAVDFFHPVTIGALAAFGIVGPECDGDAGAADPFAVFGNQITDPGATRAADPITLASGLRGLDVRLYVGNGAPCDVDDVLAAGALEISLEVAVKDMSDDFHAALAGAGVPHFYDAYGCGLHTRRYIQRDVHAWWGPTLDVIGSE